MKLVMFSDIHADYNFKLPKGDVLIFCGDFSGMGTMQDVVVFNKFLIDHKDEYEDILVVYGNHETQVESNMDVVRGLFTGCKTLTDEGVKIGKIMFYGTPWTVQFYDWAFMKPDKDLVNVYSQIPEDADVVIAHGPPYGILDQNKHSEHCGSKALLDRMAIVTPKICCFGHIHEAYGMVSRSGTTFVNCSLLNDNYEMTNKPIVLDV
jgi:Icc-related predicted phosphoesterase